ncbi:polysaccharide biosynthesis C-terminal domain-containing protein [Haloferax sp. YSMS24]|uniref:oligosaccharide flippase family protein n=1 Tax=Haloferax sp. YSMS24 TaxID=3388425 RepID=UPI00398CBBD4
MKKGQTSFVDLFSRFALSIAGFATNLYIANKLGSGPLGTYFLALTLISWGALFGNLGVQESVKKRLSEASSSWGHVSTGFLVQSFLYIILSILIIVFSEEVNQYVGFQIARLLVLMLGIQLLFDFEAAVLEGSKRVHLSSLLNPLWWVGRSVLQISLLALGIGLVGLFWGYLIAGTITVLAGFYLIGFKWEIPSRSHFRSIVSFAKYSWIRPIKGRAFDSMDTVVLGFFVTNNLIGVYGITWNLASVLSIFGVSISKTLFPEISELASKGEFEEVRKMVSAALSYAGLFLIPGIIGAALLGESLLKIYGDGFSIGYSILLILTVARLLGSFETQLTNTLDAIDHPDASFRVHSVFIVLNLTLNVVLVSQFGWIGAAVATTATAFVSLVLAYRALTDFVEVRIPFREISKQLLSALIMGAVVYVGKLTFGDSLFVSLLLVGVGSSIYFGILVTISGQFRRTIQTNLPQGLKHIF